MRRVLIGALCFLWGNYIGSLQAPLGPSIVLLVGGGIVIIVSVHNLANSLEAK